MAATENADTVTTLAREIGTALAPLAELLDPARAVDFLFELGLVFPPSELGDRDFSGGLRDGGQAAAAIPGLIAKVDAARDGELVPLLEATSNLLDAVVEVGRALDAMASAIGALAGSIGGNATEFAGTLARRVLDYLVIRYLEGSYPRLGASLALLGVVDVDAIDPESSDPARPPHFRYELRLDRIGRLLREPAEVMREEYQWGEPSFDGAHFLQRFAAFLAEFGVPGRLREATPTRPADLDLFLFNLAAKTDISPPGMAATFNFGLEEKFTIELPFFVDGWGIEVAQDGALDAGLSVVISPPGQLSLTPPSGELRGRTSIGVVARNASRPLDILAVPQIGASLTAEKARALVGVAYRWDGASAAGDPFIELRLDGARLSIATDTTDGFTRKVTPKGGVAAPALDVGIGWSPARGVYFLGGGFEATIPVHETLGPFRIDFIRVKVGIDAGRLSLDTGVVGAGTLGPVTALFDGIGFSSRLALARGRLGIVDFDASFLFPRGLGIDIDGGPVHGGGFVTFEPEIGRYTGVLALSVYEIAVKAFGIIETRFPDGREGFSFVVVISAEFTPIQLGFGFTLLGVGGIVGINRSLNQEGLQSAIASGSLAHVLFPSDPVRDAPAILQTLASLFPPVPDHHLFGPMAKLGWGTPTLISAALGVVLELPGPLLALLGVVRMVLPSGEAPLVSIQLAVGGVFDLPGRRISLDARLYDSFVVTFPLSGGMAFRLDYGARPNFLLSIGGFHPSFQPPPGVPKLPRVAIELGQNGNPSLTAYGYLALTSNSAQIGAGIDLRASGGGIRLEGHIGFDAIFVFSPFSFVASIDGGVSVKFHGVGFGIHLHGELSGPSPWRLKGEVCVSVLWWDACLGLDVRFGREVRVELPPLDPWTGPLEKDPAAPNLSLKDALEDPRNWSGAPARGSESVVSLVQRPSGAPTPVDPVGAATLRQKVVPLNRTITRFGEFRPINHDRFQVAKVVIAGVEQTREAVLDDFVPAHFKDMKGSEKLSAPPYERMEAGFTCSPHLSRVSRLAEKAIEFETVLLDGQRVGHAQPPYALTRRHLVGMLGRSAAALGGVGARGIGRYVDRGKPLKVQLAPETYVVVDACTRAIAPEIMQAESYSVAAIALEAHVSENPGDAARYSVMPGFELPA